MNNKIYKFAHFLTIFVAIIKRIQTRRVNGSLEAQNTFSFSDILSSSSSSRSWSSWLKQWHFSMNKHLRMPLVVHLMDNIKNAFYSSMFYRTRLRIVCVAEIIWGFSFILHILFACTQVWVHFIIETKCVWLFRWVCVSVSFTTVLLSKNLHIHI